MLHKIFKSLKIVIRSLQIALVLVWSRTEMYCTLTGVISGKEGTLKTGHATFGTATEFKIKNWSFTRQGSAIPCKDSGDADDSVPHKPGKAVVTSGSFEALSRYGETELVVHAEVEAHFTEDDTGTDEVYHSGAIIITSMGKSLDVEGDGVVTTPYNFTVNGKLTRTDNSA